MQMGVTAAELQTGEDDLQHMSPSNIWLNTRGSASCKVAAQSSDSDIGPKKKSGAENKANDHGDASKKKKKLCLCAPTTHAGSFKCRLHRTTATSTAHRPLASLSSTKSSGTAKKSFNSTAHSWIGNLDVQPQPQPQPRLSRFGRGVGTASASSSQPISTALQSNEQFYDTHQDAAE